MLNFKGFRSLALFVSISFAGSGSVLSHTVEKDFDGISREFDCHVMKTKARSGVKLTQDEVSVYGQCLRKLYTKRKKKSASYRVVVPGGTCTITVRQADGSIRAETVPCREEKQETMIVAPATGKEITIQEMVNGQWRSFRINVLSGYEFIGEDEVVEKNHIKEKH